MKTKPVKLTRPVTVDVIEFELPHFSKRGRNYYAVINPHEAIQVAFYPSIDAHMINIMREPHHIEEAFNWETETSSREEFMAIYKTALKSITDKIEAL